MTPQQENARILLSHSQIKPEFIPHDGSTIANLTKIVEKVQPEPKPITGGEWFRFLNEGRREEIED